MENGDGASDSGLGESDNSVAQRNGSGGDGNAASSNDVDLNNEQNALLVDISDALSERDRVKFTVHTKTMRKDFQKQEMSVVRDHDEFVWLHGAIEENIDYHGYIVPPAPPRPDFEHSREKLQKLGEGESTMTKEEFAKMKKELEAEYLATFKKTVAMHEVFLCRLAVHPVFATDANLRVFLEYENELSVRTRNKKEKAGSMWKRFTQSADEVLLSGQKDVDDFYEHEKNYLVEYHNLIKDATYKADRMSHLHKAMADTFIKIADTLEKLATMEGDKELQQWMLKVGDTFEKSRQLEARVATDLDLKQSDTLRYFFRDTQAAKDLLYRRMKCLSNYEGANKNLERARAKNKDVKKAEFEQQFACQSFEAITGVAKQELMDLKRRRVIAFKKNLTEMAELQIKHAKAHTHLLKSATDALKGGSF